MKRFGRIYFICLVLTLLMSRTFVFGQEKNYFARPGIGLSIGSWSPINLDIAKAVDLASTKTSPFSSIFFITPFSGGSALRLGLGFWRQFNVEDEPGVNSVVVLPLSVDLKHQMIPQARLSPYVSYGLTAYFGAENPEENRHQATELGLGGSVGAGLDYAASHRWVVGVEFQYVYAQLRHKIGQTDNYSGPKITLTFSYMF